jgi:hypothetical protein
MSEAIRFQAQTFKIQTMQAGGWRLTLDGWDLSAFSDLAKTQQPGIILEVAAVPIIVEKEIDGRKHNKIHI